MLTLTEIENRLIEAAYALRAMSDRERGWLYNTNKNSWPEVVHDAIDAYGWTSLPSSAMRPGASNEAIDTCIETLLWLNWLDRDTCRLVFLRVNDVRWSRLERKLWRFPRSRRTGKRKRQALLQHYQRGLRRVQIRQARDGNWQYQRKERT